jgi:hypothetical protein
MNVPQGSFKPLQLKSDVAGRKKSAPVISDMLSSNAFSKPHWMYEKITKNDRKNNFIKVKNEKLNRIIILR